MQKSLYFQRSSSAAFYHTAGTSLCCEFVNTFALGEPEYIKATVTNKRPHQSRWRKVTRIEGKNKARVNRVTFALLPEHTRLLSENDGLLWIKIAPANKRDYKEEAKRSPSNKYY
jgi:hypothetical protein